MKNKILSFLFLSALIYGAVICSQRGVFDVFAKATDLTAPTLKSVTIYPTTVHTGSYFMVTIAASDDNSGVVAANVVLESPSGQSVLHAEPLYGDNLGNWKSYILMPTGYEAGTWKISSVYLADSAGNSTSLYYGNQITSTFKVEAGTGANTQQLANVTICGTFNYGDWSTCQKNGTQRRSILNAFPTDCVGGTPILTQSCTYLYQCDDARPYLNDMKKGNCTSSRGTWDSTNCICTCPTGWHMDGTSCVYIIPTSPNSPVLADCTSANYSAWSACQSDGTQSRTLLSTASCTGNSTLVQSCLYVPPVTDPTPGTSTETDTAAQAAAEAAAQAAAQAAAEAAANATGSFCNTTRPILNDQNKSNCESSGGSWNSTKCVCTCQSGWEVQGTSCVPVTVKIENTCQSFEYSDWTECASGKQSRVISKRIPENCTGGTPEDLQRYCIVSTTCTKDDWVCGEWTACTDGKQKRTCNLTSDCPTVVSEVPTKEQSCVSAVTTKVNCNYTYTDWGDCANGSQYRTVATRLPAQCTDTTTEALVKACDSQAIVCQYTYGDWSDCTDGKRTRKLISTYPDKCSGTPAVAESCVNTDIQVSKECLSIGWTNKSDCDLYTYRKKIIADCQNSNLTNIDSCRAYMLSAYGKPSKCNSISGVACDNLIDNVILSDFKDVIPTNTKEQLSDISGSSGVIDTQQGTITVQVKSTAEGQPDQPSEVKVADLPIVSFGPDNVSTYLMPTSNTSSTQDNLSPVGISFDSDGDTLPDDVERRLGTDPFNKDTDGDGVDDNIELQNGTNPLDPLAKTTSIVLSGVDKAIVDGKTLEQPKFATNAVSDTLTVDSVQNVKENTNNNLKFQGKAKPNQVVVLYIYSVMPIVVTVKADSNGNWVYELDKSLIDGTHEVYVAINDDAGKIVESSLPTPFFIAQAEAVSVDNFVATGDASQVTDKTNNMIILYVLGGMVVVFVLIAAVLIIRQRYSE